jgi:hypothetical protein
MSISGQAVSQAKGMNEVSQKEIQPPTSFLAPSSENPIGRPEAQYLPQKRNDIQAPMRN